MREVHKPDKMAELLEEFFFEAMQNGYAVSASSAPVVGLPGSKSIRYRRGDLLLVDLWFVAPHSSVSHGMTVISLAGSPVWVMHYGGWYYEKTIPFLKRAIARNYDQRVFLGGRGPQRLEGEGHTLQYLNAVEQNGFANFRGRESIIAASRQTGFPEGQLLGEHRYFGGLML